MKNRLIRILVIFILGLSALVAVGLYVKERPVAVIKEGKTTRTSMPGVKIGGPYELTDHMRNIRTPADFAGQYKLIYFGFTFCPAICPTELQKITALLKTLPDGAADTVQPLFITVDPERDTPEALKDYLSLFHEDFIGLTGSQDKIDEAMKAYRVFARKVQSPEMSDYTVDHSSYIYFMSPEDDLLGMYRIKDTIDYIRTEMLSQMPPIGNP